jgi:SAM-dependent methyltransferase
VRTLEKIRFKGSTGKDQSLGSMVSRLSLGLFGAGGQTEAIRFRCNICGGAGARRVLAEFGRENASCDTCHSTVRMRGVVHLVSMAMFGKSLALPEFPVRPDIRGIGMSDWDEYANRLASRVTYTNTFYHQEPHLDVTEVPEELAGSCDFVISTDVFEHVAPPVSKAFDGALRLLKPGGYLVLTVPFATEESETREHFPTLHNYKIVAHQDGRFKLINTLPTGEVEEFEDLIFHGGPGTTLEMRLFAKQALQRHFEYAGFTDIRFADESVPEFGIHWLHPWSVPVVARAPIN